MYCTISILNSFSFFVSLVVVVRMRQDGDTGKKRHLGFLIRTIIKQRKKKEKELSIEIVQ